MRNHLFRGTIVWVEYVSISFGKSFKKPKKVSNFSPKSGASVTIFSRLQILSKLPNYCGQNVQTNVRFVGSNLSSKYGNTDKIYETKKSSPNPSASATSFCDTFSFFFCRKSQLHRIVYYVSICCMCLQL